MNLANNYTTEGTDVTKSYLHLLPDIASYFNLDMPISILDWNGAADEIVLNSKGQYSGYLEEYLMERGMLR